MYVRIDFDTGNAAFADEPYEAVRDVLQAAYTALDSGDMLQRGVWQRVPLRDLNGNTVGTLEVRNDN